MGRRAPKSPGATPEPETAPGGRVVLDGSALRSEEPRRGSRGCLFDPGLVVLVTTALEGPCSAVSKTTFASK